MTFVSVFLLVLLICSLCALIPLTTEVFSQNKKINSLKDELFVAKSHRNFWFNKSQHYYDLYISEKKKSNGSVTWRNIMGFSKEEKITKDKLEKRYKALARAYHPDLESGSNYAMKLLNLAKEKADKNV